MKALTVRQPWASLIMTGVKDVENRTWKTTHRGLLVVHSGSAIDRSERADAHRAGLDALPRGVILGTVTVLDCVRGHTSPWAIDDCWHWILTDPRPLDTPLPAAGKLGLWDWKPQEDVA